MTLLILFVLLCLLLLGGMSVPFAFGAALLYLGFLAETDVATFLASGHWRMSNIVLLAIPLFVLAGAIMNRGKLAEPLVDIASLIMGRIRGGCPPPRCWRARYSARSPAAPPRPSPASAASCCRGSNAPTTPRGSRPR